MVKVIWRETGSPQLRIPDQFRRVPLAVDGPRCHFKIAAAAPFLNCIETVPRFKDEDDLPALYRRLAKLLKLAPDEHTEQVFKQILGNCQSIVESLGAIRNKLGDAHSQGPKRARPQARHAELAVNLAGTMATFLIATWEARQRDDQSKPQGALHDR